MGKTTQPETKKWYESKTIWINIGIVCVVAVLQEVMKLDVFKDPTVLAFITMFVNVLLRLKTDTAVTVR